MDLEEDFIKYCVRWALDNCKDDLQFLNQMIDKTLIARLEGVLKDTFVRLPYTEGINILQEAIKNGKKFEFPCNWGDDLASEHERYLVEEHFKKPVIMTDYPRAFKSFYMKQNEPADESAGTEASVGYKGAVAPGPTMQGTDVLFTQVSVSVSNASSCSLPVCRTSAMSSPSLVLPRVLSSKGIIRKFFEYVPNFLIKDLEHIVFLRIFAFVNKLLTLKFS